MSGTPSGRPARFLCDQNLGRLAGRLRMLGLDAQYMPYWDEERVRQAILDGRIVLTRKTSMIRHDGVVFIAHDHVNEQIQGLSKVVGLRQDSAPFTRCTICNEVLEGIGREQAKGLVPEYVYATQESFSRCPVCLRIYWKGTHFTRAWAMIAPILKE